MKNKMRIKRLEKTFIRDCWGNLTNCFWNEMIKNEIQSLNKKD